MSDKIKLPVIDTLTGALSFAAKRFPTVIKVALLPSLLLYVPIIWIAATSLSGLMDQIPSLTALEETNELSDGQALELFSALAPFYLVMLLLLPLSLLYNAMVGVPLSRAIVLDEKPGFFRLDSLVWRYFFGQIVMFFLILGLMLAILGTAGVAIIAFDPEENLAAAVAIGLFALFFFVFVTVRLSLFMVEVAISGKFAVRDAFRVTRGNVMRLIGAGLLFVLLLLAVQIVFELVFYLFGGLALAANFNAIEVAAEAEDLELMIDAIRRMIVSPLGGVFAGVFAVYTLFMTGVQIAFPALIYRNLGGGSRSLGLIAEK